MSRAASQAAPTDFSNASRPGAGRQHVVAGSTPGGTSHPHPDPQEVGVPELLLQGAQPLWPAVPLRASAAPSRRQIQVVVDDHQVPGSPQCFRNRSHRRAGQVHERLRLARTTRALHLSVREGTARRSATSLPARRRDGRPPEPRVVQRLGVPRPGSQSDDQSRGGYSSSSLPAPSARWRLCGLASAPRRHDLRLRGVHGATVIRRSFSVGPRPPEPEIPSAATGRSQRVTSTSMNSGTLSGVHSTRAAGDHLEDAPISIPLPSPDFSGSRPGTSGRGPPRRSPRGHPVGERVRLHLLQDRVRFFPPAPSATVIFTTTVPWRAVARNFSRDFRRTPGTGSRDPSVDDAGTFPRRGVSG